MVEVALPQDPSDIFAHWLTRYNYDLSDSNTSGIYGNLAVVQRYVPGATQSGTNVSAAYQWLTTKSWTYDALNRTTHQSYYAPGATSMSTDMWTYDTTGAGLLSNFSNAMGESVSYSYDTLGQVTRRDLATGGNELDSYGRLPSEEMTYDPDGRLHSYNNDETGMAFYNYNPDGTLQSYSEPNAVASWTRPSSLGAIGPLTAVKTYNYSYYADGMLSQLATSDGNYSQRYSYRADGLLQSQKSDASWAISGDTIVHDTYTWYQSFTPAGRITSKSDAIADPCPAGQTCRVTMSTCASGCTAPPALSVTYDPYGRNESWAIPTGTYRNFTYDLEGEPTSFTTTTPPGGNTAPTWTLAYSTRGELLSENNPMQGTPFASFRSADGFMYAACEQNANGDCVTAVQTFDTRTSTITSSRLQGLTLPTTFTYDLAGRRTGSRQYDALNRLIKATKSYAYGPGTIPFAVNGLTQHAPLGQTPLLATDSNGNVLDVKLGMNSDILPSDTFTGLTVYDRDPFGFVAAQRNSTGTSAWTVPNMFSGCDTADAGDTGIVATTGFAGNMFNSCKSGGELYPYRTDGYFDGSLTFRGVRAYDADTQQWSTSDAFSGYPADPISTLGYNYAHNNPAVFVDPSGFDSTFYGGCPTGYTYNDEAGWHTGESEIWFDCLLQGFADDTMNLIAEATGPAADFGGKVFPNLALHGSASFQAGLFGADADVGATPCGLVFGGVGAHAGGPFTFSGGASLMIDYAWAGPAAYIGNGWSAGGGYDIGLETGGSVSRTGPQGPGYAGFGLTTPGAQINAGKNASVNLHLCGK